MGRCCGIAWDADDDDDDDDVCCIMFASLFGVLRRVV